jgi:hypothetical protein
MSEHHSITGEAVEAAVRESGQHLLTFSDDQQRHIICTCGGEISETDTHRIRAILAAAEPYMRQKWVEELVERIRESNLGAPLHIYPDGTARIASGPEIQKLLEGKPISADNISGPRNPGDDVYVELEGRRYAVNCYETIHHEWKLQNSGKIPWENRRLALVNQADIHPRPVQAIIPLPDTRPGEQIKIATDIDSRGFEGDYECRWEMQDANGENCFPNKRWDFNIRIHVAFNAMAGGEERG